MPLSAGHILFCFFCIISCSLIFYYLYFFSRLAFYKPQTNAKSNENPLSIIVCARNEEKNIEENIPHLLQQKYSSQMELVIVNDHSEDNTKQVLQWMAHNNRKLHIVNIEGGRKNRIGKKYPLSIGIREAKSDFLLLTDADCKPASIHWAEEMTHAYMDDIEIVLGYGAYEKQNGFLNKLIRFETFHSALQYLSYALAGQPYMGVGRNLSYKKDLFIRNKGFAGISHIPGGDDDLFINRVANANNTAIVIDADAHTISTPKKTWREWMRQKTRHYSTSKYYKPAHKFLLGTYSLAQFLFYLTLIANLILFNWKMAIALLLIKSIIQWFVFSKAMKKLNESDLVKWIFLMDLFMFFYYILFASALWKKKNTKW